MEKILIKYHLKLLIFFGVLLFLFTLLADMPYFNLLFSEAAIKWFIAWFVCIIVFRISYWHQALALGVALLLLLVTFLLGMASYEPLGLAIVLMLLTIAITMARSSQS